MSLPESMSRIVIVGTRSRMDEAIDALYSVEAVHLIDHTTGADEGFAIGESRPYTSQASERLLKARAMEKELGINKHTKAPIIPANEIKAQISSGSVESVESEVFATLDKRNGINQSITDLKNKIKDLTLLSKVPVDLELYDGYKSIVSFVGSVKADPSEGLKTIADLESFVSIDKKQDGVVAVFVKTSEKDKVASILADCGFTEISVPEGKGSPEVALKAAEEELVALEASLEKVGTDIEALREKHKSFLRASEEDLAISVEQGSLPLKVATSEYSFVIDAWVPTAKAEVVKNDIEKAMNGNAYVEIEEARGRNLHEEEKAEDRFKTAPSKMDNTNYGKLYEYPTKLVSVPKYQEIDPSILIGIFLPLFFGFMVGDVGYAIPFIILGAYGLKIAKNKDWRAIATVLFFGGIWAFIFGFFFFGEMLGMHFATGLHASATTVSWEQLLCVTMPEWFNQLTGQFGLIATGHVGGVGKLSEVTFLLKLSVYVGIVHLLIGYVCAFINVKMQHGAKDAFWHKGGWIITFIGMVIVCWALTEILFKNAPIEGTLMYMTIIGAVTLIAGIVINFKTEKMQAILELPGIVGNILSYTRLAAIGMSKAGMALAFNYMAILMLPGMIDGAIGIILGFVIFAFGHLMIWTLAILSAGLHGLRLQYVELMSKFFEGGGDLFSPLAVKRKQTKPINEKSITEV